MSFGGESSFHQSEAGRLLRLARKQPGSSVALDALLARHLELVRSGAQLPAWAASYVPHATTWFSLIGTGPIVALVAGGGVVVAITTLTPEPAPPAPPRAALTKPAAAAGSQVQAEASPTEVEPTPAADERACTRAERASNGEMTPRAVAHTPSAPAEHDMPGEPSGELEPSPRPASQQSQQALPQQPRPQQPQPQQPQPPQPGARGSGDPAEMQGIAEAEQLLSSDPARALAISRQLRTRFPQGYFVEERAYVEVMALLELGRTAEARAKADAFGRAYPNGPYSRRVRDAIERRRRGR
jgi:hypothetical protein